MNKRHYVISSRKLMVKDGKNVYLNNDDNSNNGMDGALNHFNIGRYQIHNDMISEAEFITNSNHPELNDFNEFIGDFHKPKELLNPIFEEIFTHLIKEDKMLYIYQYGFGNDIQSEKQKQVLPMSKCYMPNNDSSIGEMLFLSWPSQGKTEYKHGEKQDVSEMARMVLIFLLKLRYYTGNTNNPLFKDWQPKIVFHAQSMGCKILQCVVERLNFLENANIIKKGILDKYFHRVIMTGADVPVNSMNDLPDEEGEEIHQLCKRLILFVNKRDVALWISRFIFSSGRRLGRNLQDEDFHLLPHNLELIKLKNGNNDFVGHNYFTEMKHVATLVQNLLNPNHADGLPLSDRGRTVLFDAANNIIEDPKFFS